MSMAARVRNKLYIINVQACSIYTVSRFIVRDFHDSHAPRMDVQRNRVMSSERTEVLYMASSNSVSIPIASLPTPSSQHRLITNSGSKA